VDHRPSDLDPYPRLGRDLAAGELWAQSLERSRQRRRLERASRSHRQRRKGTSLAVGAAMLASPVVPAFAGGAGKRGSRPGAGAAASDTSSLAAVTGGRTELLGFGDVGPAVAAVQRQVAVDDDGIFGLITQAGVQRFQRAHGLAVTGVVDARTWAALFNGRVLFYDRSGDRAAPPARTAVVRLVVGDEDGPAGSREGTGAPPSPAEEPSAEEPSAEEPSAGDPSGDGGSGDDGTPAPRPAPAPRPVAPTTQTPAGGCTDGRVGAPVQGTVTGRFGEGRGDHSHTGLDIAAPSGSPIHAVQCGTVAQSGSESGYGLMVCVRHAGGVTTCYAHMSRTQASVNQEVRAGQVIGYVGCTGSCTGPHVHVEVRRNGRAEDPAPYLAGQRTIAGATATAASVRRGPTTSAGGSSRTLARAAVQTGATAASATDPTQDAPLARPAPAAAAPAGAPAPTTSAPAQSASAPAPAPAPVTDESAPARVPAPEQSTPEPAPAPEQSAPAAVPAPEPPPAPEQSAPVPAPEPPPAPEQSAPVPAAEPPPAPDQSAPAPAADPAQAAPAPDQAPAQSARAAAREHAPTTT